MSKVRIVLAPKNSLLLLPLVNEMLAPYDVDITVNETALPFTKEQTILKCSDAEAIMSELEILDEEVLSQCKKLRYISKFGSGTDNIDIEYAKKNGIEVRRAAFANNVSVAEMAIALMFVLFRGLYFSINSVKNKQWERIFGNEVFGKTAGIIGMGAIGRETIRMCAGLGMHVIVFDSFCNDSDFVSRYNIKKAETMEDVLMQADVVFLHVPLLPETRQMINDNTLRLMKSTAYLVNTSRGGLIDEEALYRALKDGVIAGAGADVFSKEPPDPHPILDLDNFILAPHNAAYTKEATEKCIRITTQNLIDMLF